MADEKEAAQPNQTFTSADRIRQLNDVDKVSVAIAELRRDLYCLYCLPD